MVAQSLICKTFMTKLVHLPRLTKAHASLKFVLHKSFDSVAQYTYNKHSYN